jgi:LacI family transcriptional regulator
MTDRPATQQDIAAALGIAQRTVSRAFSAPTAVTAALRQRILAMAAALGYRPHSGARTMRTGRCDQVLLVQGQHATTSNLPAGTLSGLLDGLTADGVLLGIVRFDDEQLNRDGFLPSAIRDLRSDGLLINYTSNIPARLRTHIARHRIPAVWLNSRQQADCVHPDDLAAGRLLTDHLLALGHRRIAWVDLHLGHTRQCHYSRHDRRQGYRTAMAAAGLAPMECIPAQEVPPGDLAAATAGVLSGAQRATAVACYSTLEASAVMRCAGGLGLRLPTDLSLAVVDDAQAYLGMPMTTALLDSPELGRQAASSLLARIADPRRRLTPVAVPPRLAIGLSTAPPAPPAS